MFPHRVFRLVCLTLLASGAAHSQSRVGQPTPPLELKQVLQGDKQLPRPGHPLLIEIWATWCGPCTASIPHVNDLYERFAARGVDFLWLSEDDPANKVGPFLSSHRMLGTVAIDGAEKQSLLFGEEGLPTTVLIDSKGRVAAITRSADVRPENLEELIERKPLSMTPVEADYHLADPHVLFGDTPVVSPNASVKVVIWRTNQPGSLMSSADSWRTNGANAGVPLKELLAKAYGLHESQITIPDYLNELYGVQAWVPSRTPESLNPMMQSSLLAAASVHVHHVSRTMKVLVLHGLSKLAKARQGGSIAMSQDPPAPNRFRWVSISSSEIRDQLQVAFADMPVILDKPLPGWFAFSYQNDPTQPFLLTNSLKLEGLSLREETRTMDCLVVEDAVSLKVAQ